MINPRGLVIVAVLLLLGFLLRMARFRRIARVAPRRRGARVLRRIGLAIGRRSRRR